jgi:transposase
VISDRVISYSRLIERRDNMGKVTRKRYGSDFKAKVALEAIRGEQTQAELSAKHSIHQTKIAAWKRQAIEGLASTFSGKAEAVQAIGEAELTRLHAKIGQLVVERDFLAKASGG